jgi:hypothetical protein
MLSRGDHVHLGVDQIDHALMHEVVDQAASALALLLELSTMTFVS